LEESQKFFEEPRNPLPGGILFEALRPYKNIILAVNPRVTSEVIEGILKACKDTGQVVIMELALSEMNLHGGYTRLTPKLFAERVRLAAETVGWYGYVLHADHLTVKKGTENELKDLKREIDARIEAGFTSFAVDSSFLFDREARNLKDRLKAVVENAIYLHAYIKDRLEDFPYGREGEVGEIGIKEYTEVAEALHYLRELKKADIDIHFLAIANGAKHGVTVDAEGKIVPQLKINLKRTVEIADAIKAEGFTTRIVQHGITGTPLHLIAEKFPKGKILKGNVGTFWMLLVWDILRIFEPDLYQKIHDWVVNKYYEEGKSEAEIFSESSKYAIKFFFREIEKISQETRLAIKSKAYVEALMFFKAFGMEETAKKVYEYISKKGIDY